MRRYTLAAVALAAACAMPGASRGPLATGTEQAALLRLGRAAFLPEIQLPEGRAGNRLNAAPSPDALRVANAAEETAGGAHYSDADMAAAFMELAFALESGRALPQFSRFEGVVTLALQGEVPANAPREVAQLLNRLRTEAGIDIRPARPGEAASITLDFRPQEELRRVASQVACFVAPNVASLAEYRASRGLPTLDWARVAERRRVGIFLPSDGTAQEIHDCLHEEVAQALGPLNDLYRLTDSVFNDDNFHSRLTGFDMTILRAFYAPELSSGMSREEVAERIDAVMARVNGRPGAPRLDASPTPRGWTNAIAAALNDEGSPEAARTALTLALEQGWQDGRLALSHFALARSLAGRDPVAAVRAYSSAAAIYRGLPGGAVPAAHIDMQLAAIAVAAGEAEKALRFADRALPVIETARNATLLASTLMIKAEALELLGEREAARALRVDSAPIARYGFGSEARIHLRRQDVASLGPGLPRG